MRIESYLSIAAVAFLTADSAGTVKVSIGPTSKANAVVSSFAQVRFVHGTLEFATRGSGTRFRFSGGSKSSLKDGEITTYNDRYTCAEKQKCCFVDKHSTICCTPHALWEKEWLEALPTVAGDVAGSYLCDIKFDARSFGHGISHMHVMALPNTPRNLKRLGHDGIVAENILWVSLNLGD